jgi:hypothetical protein
MKSPLRFILTSAFGVCMLTGSFLLAQDPGLRVVPTPQHVERIPQTFKLSAQTRIILGSSSTPADEFAARQINELLIELGRTPLRIVREESVRRFTRDFVFLGSPRSPYAATWLKKESAVMDPRMKDEGYLLHASQDAVLIIAESPRGRFYGATTLGMIFDQEKKSVVVPGVFIRDWPGQRLRGVTDDVSRGQVSTQENFKKIIRLLARYKLNVYSPYIEDIFVLKLHPKIGKGRGELTAAEVRELDAYARQYHVELIPIFQTLGHWENILVLPEYLRYAEFPGASGLNVANDSIYPLLDGMIAEVSAAFSSPYFNMAADESMNVGLGGSKALVAATDIATVHADHYMKLFAILKKYNKKPMMYGDMILSNPKILEKIPKNVVIVDWQYDPADRYPTTLTFKNAGFPFVVSPSVLNYNGPFPNYIHALANIRNLTREGYRNGSLGVLTSGWNNFGGESLRELTFYGYAWTAECAWNPTGPDLEAFDNRFFGDFFGSAAAGKIGQTVYALLSASLNQIHWFEVWRHPFLPPRSSTPPMVVRLESLRSTVPLLRQLLQELHGAASANRDHIRSLSFVVKLSDWFARKVETADRLRNALEDTTAGEVRSTQIDAAVAQARKLMTDLQQLKMEFSSLWLETNRPANLNLLMQRYDRQVQYWEEALQTIESLGAISDPLIESQWIYHPSGNPGKRDSSAQQVRKATFRKTFTLREIPASAKVQMIGDTHVRLRVNGSEVGELYARRTPSLFVEHHRVKIWDIAPLLRAGENVMTVDAANHDRFGSAGVNVYAEFRVGAASVTLLSDATWEVMSQQSEESKQAKGTAGEWIPAIPRPYPYLVVKPHFATGRVSWIER